VIVDSSALVALLHKEKGYERLLEALLTARVSPRMASPNFVETAIVVDGRRDPALSRRFDDLIEKFGIEVVPFTAEHARIAREAYRDFGKGSGHPARLNFGDSMAYALASSAREPLLFVGDDFPHTDIEAA
jgi:ribonuclease VapC